MRLLVSKNPYILNCMNITNLRANISVFLKYVQTYFLVIQFIYIWIYCLLQVRISRLIASPGGYFILESNKLKTIEYAHKLVSEHLSYIDQFLHSKTFIWSVN